MVDKKWWLACVLHLTPDESEAKVKLLHSPGPSKSFRYPPADHTVKLDTKDVLTSVDPRTRTGRVYTITLNLCQTYPHSCNHALQTTIIINVVIVVHSESSNIHVSRIQPILSTIVPTSYTYVFHKPIEIPIPNSR